MCSLTIECVLLGADDELSKGHEHQEELRQAPAPHGSGEARLSHRSHVRQGGQDKAGSQDVVGSTGLVVKMPVSR